MANTALGRMVVAPLTNKSGGDLTQGAVVIVSSGTAAAFTTTTTVGYADGQPGVIIEPNGIANNATGLVAFAGPIPKINLSGSASLGDLFKTHSVAGQAVRHAAPMVTGDFGIVLETGTTPKAILFGLPHISAAGNVAVDSIFDAKGDLPVGTGADTAAKLTVGANGTRLEAASGEATGVKWSDVGTLLAYKVYTGGNFTLNNATMGDVDATNMAVTFTAPVSGNVLVRLSAGVGGSDTLDAYQSWGIREASSTIIGAAGTSIVHREPVSGHNNYHWASVAFVLTGISAGSHTYKWAAAQSSGTALLRAEANGPAVMEVWALP